jgi:hypothetical protein
MTQYDKDGKMIGDEAKAPAPRIAVMTKSEMQRMQRRAMRRKDLGRCPRCGKKLYACLCRR